MFYCRTVKFQHARNGFTFWGSDDSDSYTLISYTLIYTNLWRSIQVWCKCCQRCGIVSLGVKSSTASPLAILWHGARQWTEASAVLLLLLYLIFFSNIARGNFALKEFQTLTWTSGLHIFATWSEGLGVGSKCQALEVGSKCFTQSGVGLKCFYSKQSIWNRARGQHMCWPGGWALMIAIE